MIEAGLLLQLVAEKLVHVQKQQYVMLQKVEVEACRKDRRRHSLAQLF